MSESADMPTRAVLVRQGQLFSRITLIYNACEGLAAIITGVMAGSIVLVGFGLDSIIEVISGAAALWRLRADVDVARREHAERFALRIIGACFVGLALYIAADAGQALVRHEMPSATLAGTIVAGLSVVVMPVLARRKRRIAIALGSRALQADAVQTALCVCLSAIVLIGLLLNATLGWWWADPVAALVMTPIIAREGIDGLRGNDNCDHCGTS
ncbi:MAG: cation transporter [Gemmatimonadota bacterium]|nr:cation transporter [Gemmatimonadota bacterium]